MFQLPVVGAELTQGDIIDNCPLLGWLDDQPETGPAELFRWTSRVIVLTQACDLVQGKADRVLVGQLHSAEELVNRGLLKSSTIRDHIARHAVFGWYFLPAVNEPVPLPESIVDLRDLQAIPRIMLDALIARGQRVASLESPYREHLAQHFAVTYMRVALPEPYKSLPAA